MCLLNKGANVLVVLLANESNHPEISVSFQVRHTYVLKGKLTTVILYCHNIEYSCKNMIISDWGGFIRAKLHLFCTN